METSGADPPAQSTVPGNASVLPPVPSCFTFIIKAPNPVPLGGFEKANVVFSVRVVVKLSPSCKLKVAVQPEEETAVVFPALPPKKDVTLFASAPNIFPVLEGSVRVPFHA